MNLLRVMGAGVAAVVLLTACEASISAPEVSQGAAEGSGLPARPLGFEEAPFVRDCSMSVWGRLGPDWDRYAVRAGPLTFLNGAGLSIPSGHIPRKLLVLVDEGQEATVSLRSDLVGSVALFYDPFVQISQSPTVEQGQKSVTFVGCAPGESPHGKRGPTQFAGALLAPELDCIHLAVESGDRSWDVALPKKCN